MLFAIRSTLIVAVILLLALVAWRPRRVGQVLLGYFTAESGPLNLGIFRLVVFGMLFNRVDWSRLAGPLALPATFREPLPGWEWFFEWLPMFDTDFAESVYAITVVAAALACVGLGTRIAAPVAALGAIYVLGLAQFFGKVNHGGHALVWSAIVLSASPCHHALSLDALLSTARQGRWRVSLPARRRVAYALPLRICWVLFGVAYFFPGLFKAWEAGDLWISGDALHAILLGGMARDPDFVPLIAAYDYPFLTVAAGAGTLLFELGFLPILFSRRFYWIAPTLGTLFHVGVRAFVGISFFSMLRLYVCFVNFEWLLGKLARKLPSSVCEHLALEAAAAVDSEPAQRPEPASTEHPATGLPGAPRVAPAATVGGLLIVANLYTGFAMVDSWPVSAFPRFASRAEPKVDNTYGRQVVFVNPRRGKRYKVDRRKLRGPIRKGRWDVTLKRIVRESNKTQRRRQLLGLVRVIRRAGYKVRSGDQLQVFYIKYWRAAPGTREVVVRKKLLLKQRL